ncbi:uncharacterized protein LOC131930672 [Physella acuta]|uniref:uncharacterized protein LOC131930672 n=1 Tax=Physella acuta TaxID=109671 RepID=UPI0027DB06C4|nr:uncharacterized protein LOC131930672 [Physella acuta]
MSPIKMRQAHLSDKIKTEIGPSSPYTKDSTDTNGEKTTDSPPLSNEIDSKLRKTTSEKETLRPPNASPNSRNKDTKSFTKRTENWTNGEKTILLRLVKTKREIIETKHRNKDAKEQRNKAWDQILAELKSKCPRFANISTNCVKEQYQRLKSQVKKYLTKPDDSKTSGEAHNNIAIVKLMCDICQEEFKDFNPIRNDDEDDNTSDRNKDKLKITDELLEEEVSVNYFSSRTPDEEKDFPEPNPKKDPSRTTNYSPATFKASSPDHVKLEPTNSNRVAEDREMRVHDQKQFSNLHKLVVSQNPYKLEIGKHNDVQSEKVLSTDVDVHPRQVNSDFNSVNSTDTVTFERNNDELKNLRSKHQQLYSSEVKYPAGNVIRRQKTPYGIMTICSQEDSLISSSDLSEIEKSNYVLMPSRDEYVRSHSPIGNYNSDNAARPFEDEYNTLENRHRLVKSKGDLSVTDDDLQHTSQPDSTINNTKVFTRQKNILRPSRLFEPYNPFYSHTDINRNKSSIDYSPTKKPRAHSPVSPPSYTNYKTQILWSSLQSPEEQFDNPKDKQDKTEINSYLGIYSYPGIDRDKSSSDFSPTKKPRVQSPAETQQFSSMYYTLGKPQISRSSSQSSDEQFDNQKDKQDTTEINSCIGPYQEDIDIHKETVELSPSNTTMSSVPSLNRNVNKRTKNLKCFINTKRRYEVQELRLQKEKHVEEMRMAREKHEIEMEMLRIKKQALEHHLQQVIKSSEQPSQHTSHISDVLISEERLSKRMPNTSGIFTTTQEILNDTSCTLYNF